MLRESIALANISVALEDCFNLDMLCVFYAALSPSVAGSDHLRDVFVKQMGLTDQDIAALSGAHTLVCIDNFFRSLKN